MLFLFYCSEKACTLQRHRTKNKFQMGKNSVMSPRCSIKNSFWGVLEDWCMWSIINLQLYTSFLSSTLHGNCSLLVGFLVFSGLYHHILRERWTSDLITGYAFARIYFGDCTLFWPQSWSLLLPVYSVCLCLLCLVCSMIPLVFLQVLEPFCPLSEQENSEPEELDVSQPTCSTTVFIPTQTELNSSPLPSGSSSPNQKNPSCTTSLIDIETVSHTADALPSFVNADSDVPPPLSDIISASQPCLVSVSPLPSIPSDSHLGVLTVEDDSCIPPQPQRNPTDSHPCVEVTVPSLSENLFDECNSPPLKITPNCSLQTEELCSLQVPNNPSDSLV